MKLIEKIVTRFARKYGWIPTTEADEVLKHFGANVKTLHFENRSKLFQYWNMLSQFKFDKAFNKVVITNQGEEKVYASEYVKRMEQYRVAYNMNFKELAEDFRNGNVGFTEYLQFLMGQETWFVQFANDLQWCNLTILKSYVQDKISFRGIIVDMNDELLQIPDNRMLLSFRDVMHYSLSGELEKDIYGSIKPDGLTDVYRKEVVDFCKLYDIDVEFTSKNPCVSLIQR